MVALKTNDYELIVAKPFSPNLGAEIYGVDLSQDIPDDQFAEIRDAFHNYQVLFFQRPKGNSTRATREIRQTIWTIACASSSTHDDRPSRDF